MPRAHRDETEDHFLKSTRKNPEKLHRPEGRKQEEEGRRGLKSRKNHHTFGVLSRIGKIEGGSGGET